jgi:hypothetical protein
MQAESEPAPYGLEPRKASRQYNATNAVIGGSAKVRNDNDQISGRPMEFKVFPGNGGVAISYSRYDERKEDYVSCLHIVPDSINDHDAVAKALSEIITLQAMRG